MSAGLHPNFRNESEPGAVNLGLSLPLSVFTSTERWHSERIHALAIYCSDGRWGEAFDEFCQRHLLIPRYDRLAIPGGPAWLASDEGNPFIHEQLDFLVRAHDLDKILFITHFGCAHYGQRLQKSPEECLAVQTEDMRRAAPLLRRWYPNIRVQAFLAMRNNNCLSFHQVDV